MKYFRHLALLSLVLLSACGGASISASDVPTTPELSTNASLDLTVRQQIGQVSFRSVEGYKVEEDGDGGIYIGSPDAEIGILLSYQPSSIFGPDTLREEIGATYPEEGIAIDTIAFLGFDEIDLGPLMPYTHGDYSGFRREFTGSTMLADPIQGEYLFITVGDHVFTALGTVVYVTGENRWDPQGKAAFDAVVDSVQFVPAE